MAGGVTDQKKEKRLAFWEGNKNTGKGIRIWRTKFIPTITKGEPEGD